MADNFNVVSTDMVLPGTTIVIDLNDEADVTHLQVAGTTWADSSENYEADKDATTQIKMEVCVDEFDESELKYVDAEQNMMYIKEDVDIYQKSAHCLKCSICSELFDYKSKYIEHVKNQHPVVQVFPDTYSCPFCHRTLKSKTVAEQHVRTHTNEKPYKCLQCGKTFTQKAGVKQHMKTHSNAKPYSCPICNGKYKAASTLACHISMKHDMLKPFQCKVCGMAFGHSSNLTTHMRTHTGERPYKCSFCEKTFVQQGHLVTHERLHTGEKPFKCDYCGAGFTHTGNLSQHVISQHTKDYKHRCFICEKGFIGPGDLKRHVKKAHPQVDCESIQIKST